MNKKIVPVEVTPEMLNLLEICKRNKKIDPELYAKYDVKRGLRDINGKGVLTGLTEISEIHAYNLHEDGSSSPCDGSLYYHGYNIEDLVNGFIAENRFGFEETVYLLMFGELPDRKQLKMFTDTLAKFRTIPPSFVRDIIMQVPSRDMMNALSRSVLTLYAYDDRADDITLPNVLRQCLQLIAQLPMLAVYGYLAHRYYHENASFIVHAPREDLSAAENILYMLRSDSRYTEAEARVLDLSLILHAEHGGGNNSTFATHVVTSSGTDTYSTVAASLGALKGPRHGGANIKVMQMFENMKSTVKNWHDDKEIEQYLYDVLNKKVFDRSGLIYGMGHAVYSLSDPRANVFKVFVEKLSREKGREEEFDLYSRVERLAPQVIASERKIYKGVSANVDFYSGFVYDMLNIPMELYTPMFAVSRIAGWSAHRIEELVNPGKIIRPAYKAVAKHKEYKPIDER